jgi:hypothetical protein
MTKIVKYINADRYNYVDAVFVAVSACFLFNGAHLKAFLVWLAWMIFGFIFRMAARKIEKREGK